MSEGSSVLLNMGAELASANGAGPSITSQTGQPNGLKGEFAAVLQSTLASKADTSEENPLIATEANIHPLLFNDMDNAENSLLAGDEMNLALLMGGKELPPEEQEIAWQTILAEYDSTDADTPRIVMAEGDEDSYHLETLTAEELSEALQDSQQAMMTGDEADTEQPGMESGIPEMPEAELTDKPKAGMFNTSATEQNHSRSNNPQAVTAETESVVKVAKPLSADMEQSNLSANSRQQQLEAEQQASASQLSDELKTEETGKFKQELARETAAKFDLNAMADSTANKSNQSASVNNSNNALLGSSAYSAVSALGGTAGSPQAHSNVIANMTIPPQNPAWGEVVGDRVHWMVAQNIQEAKIRLNPPELGLLEVRVQVGNDQQTSISFSSPHAQVRDALETAMPRLREMFGENGLTLGNVDVSHQSMTGQGHGTQGEENQNKATQSVVNTSGEKSSIIESGANNMITGTGMLDLYA